MEIITVIVGSVDGSGGDALKDTRQLQFEGEKLATVHHTDTPSTPGADEPVGLAAWALAQSRSLEREGQGIDKTETLYRTCDGQLLVYVQEWSCFEGESAVYSLHQVTEHDLNSAGTYSQLGKETGFWQAGGRRKWGPEGPVCRRCGETLPMSAWPSYHVDGEPVYLCYDCQMSGGGTFDR